MKNSGCLKISDSGLDKESVINEGLVYVYLFLKSISQLDSVNLLVEEITDSDINTNTFVAWVKVGNLNQLSALPTVRAIRSVSKPEVREGSVVTEGDFIHRTNVVRSTFEAEGAGVKIEIFSEGFDSRASAKATGDLPADGSGLTVLSNSVGGDEGTAMLEIVHDMVPGAELFFHDCGLNTIAFRNAIDNLIASGCQVICDDIGWIVEPFFEDGAVAAHVSNVVNTNNIIYTSSAGNAGNKHHQGVFYSQESPNEAFYDFSQGTSSSYPDLYVNIPENGNVRIVVQWDDKFGVSSNDYDLYLYSYSTGSVVQTSQVIQDGDDDPLEFINYTANSSTAGDFGIWLEKKSSFSGKRIEVYLYAGNGAGVYSNNLGAGDAIFGHPAVPECIAVGAIGASDPGNDDIEAFSSQGPVTIAYPSLQIRPKPDVSGIDGVTVTGAGGFSNPFYGTSAAAPHIAAICAQLWGSFPFLSAWQISEAVLGTSIDLGNNGFDYVFGFGRADAEKAHTALNPISIFPYECSFENNGNLPPGWYNTFDDDFDWRVNSGTTPSGSTGPSVDHTNGDASGFYIYTESSSPNNPGKDAVILTPFFDVSAMSNPFLSFWYHLYGETMGELHIDAFYNGEWINDIAEVESGNQGDVWHEKTISLSEYSGGIQLRFRAETGTSYYSDMAIDDVTIYEVPENNQISSTILTSGEEICFNATSTQVIVESGAMADFIAGQSILFKPGFHAQEGSNVNAYITTDGQYCIETSPAIVAQQQEEQEQQNEEKAAAIVTGMQQTVEAPPTMLVYPNPNSGVFTVKFSHLTEETQVMLFNSTGQLIFNQITADPEVLIDLPGITSEMYIVKAVSGSRQFSQKIVIK